MMTLALYRKSMGLKKLVSKKKASRKKDTLGKVMSKVAKGKKLTPQERKIIAGAVDGAKKSRKER